MKLKNNLMKNLLFIIITIFVLSPSSLFSQEEATVLEKKVITENTNLKHSIGFAAGHTTGYGLSYRYVPKMFGAQFTFAPHQDEVMKKYSIGLTFIVKLLKTDKVSLFLYQGNHFQFKSEEGQVYSQTSGYYDGYGNYIYPTSNYRNTTIQTNKINNGIGIGTEIIASKHLGFNFMGGYAGYDGFKTINITGEVGIFFKLK
jgi:hypothetical protein